ncbi:MAG: hypothetical protein D4R83_01260 [Streptomycetaceae bacterium]|nr:MAG: hypothetical protein D4R83_01260 [Streptomycetaceae bacterium]
MKLRILNLKIAIGSFREHFLLRMGLFFLLIISVWLIRFPFIFRKLYAEDGTLLLHDALVNPFPKEFFQPASGYSLLIQRIGGRFISIFPLEYAPITSAIFAALCLSFLAAGLYAFNNFSTWSFWPRFTLALCFIFLPSSSFSAVGNSANLYVYFMTASAVFIYYKEEKKSEVIFKCCVFSIAALSLPLTVFLIPLIIHRSIIEKKMTNRWRIQKSDGIFVLSLLLHMIFIAVTSLGERTPHSPQSLFKVLYLYLERGLGISIIPMWGFVSGTSVSPSYENTPALLNSLGSRMVVLILIIAILGVIYNRGRKVFSVTLRNQFWLILILGFTYSIIIGLFFNPEPRYMIFTSFLTYWAILLLVESQGSFILRVCLNAYLICVLILGLTASAHRAIGPEWGPGLAKAKQECSDLTPEQEVKIRILPLTPKWEIILSCKIVIGPDH